MKLLVVGEKTSVTEGLHEVSPRLRPFVKASHRDWVEEASVGLHTHTTATDLEAHLVRAIAARTQGQVQALRVQILGGRTVLSGFAESYYAIQQAVVGLQDTLDALGLDRPGQVDLNIDVMPRGPARP